MVLIKTSQSSFFFSGDISLSPGTSIEVDETKLTKTQLLDIIEAFTLDKMTSSNIDSIRERYTSVTTFDKEGIQSQIGDLSERVETLQTAELDTPANIDSYLASLEI